jgi:glycosyltransferase involved in cell wall biosynthesis
MSDLGIVTIGRNEGERLRRCLESVAGRGHTVVYVDSGSRDGSIGLARSLGVEVVELDLSLPFTAARARNAGLERLLQIDPGVAFVQVADGDCEVVPGWLERARAVLVERPEVALVFGRRRERYPEQSVYNLLADLEWGDAPLGEAKYCSGDVLGRVEALRQVGGYNPALIAGEDPDLAVRIRQHGWLILRIDAEMTLHDMAMTRFGQWWKRCERAGFAFAQGAAMHGKPPERHWVRNVRSIEFWAIAVPLFIAFLAWPTRGAGLCLALVYPLHAALIARRHRRQGMPSRSAWLWAWAAILGRFPNAIGLMRYWFSRLSGRHQALIEYKGNA